MNCLELLLEREKRLMDADGKCYLKDIKKKNREVLKNLGESTWEGD